MAGYEQDSEVSYLHVVFGHASKKFPTMPLYSESAVRAIKNFLVLLMGPTFGVQTVIYRHLVLSGGLCWAVLTFHVLTPQRR
jgi:hypothetical protein